jgi:hypothetical protein
MKKEKVLVIYGQGNGYGDGNIYVCFASELHGSRPFRRGLNKVARESARHGCVSEYESVGDFLGLFAPHRSSTVHYSKLVGKASYFKVLG